MTRLRESAETKENLVYIERVTTSLQQQGLLPDPVPAVPVRLVRGLSRGLVATR